jgi:hypothetical protein
MMRLRIISFVVLAGKLACGADGVAARDNGPRTDAGATESPSRPAVAVRLPRVLTNAEPKDSSVVTLPGAIAPKHAPAPSTPSLAPALIAPGWRPLGVPALPPAPEVPLTPTVAEPKALALEPASPRVPPSANCPLSLARPLTIWRTA